MALRVPEMCFWPAKTRKNLELFEMHTCHWPGAQTCFRHKWKNLVQLLFYFIVLMGIVASVVGMSFFFSYVWRKRMQLDSKSDLTTNGVILGVFCWEMASFDDFISEWTAIWKNCSIVILFWRHKVFSLFRLGGYSGLFFKNACNF